MTDRADASEREAYYGAGRQPWDDIVEGGLGPSFAAGSILKYLRRTKGEREKDVAKARWYFERLSELGAAEKTRHFQDARLTLHWLHDTLTAEEWAVLQ